MAQQHASDETVALRDAVNASAPDGALFHARCVLAGRHDNRVHFTDGNLSVEMPLGRGREVDSRLPLATRVVATILRRKDQTWAVVYVRTLEAFDAWQKSRGQQSAMGVFSRHRFGLDKVSKEFSD